MKIMRLVLFLLPVFFAFLAGFVFFVFIFAFVFAPVSVQANTFDKALKYANSLRGTVQESAAKFKPEKVFKDQKGRYTEDPPQASYYERSTMVGDSHELEKAAIVEVDKDESYKDLQGNPVPNPGKTVTKAFGAREVFKINPESEYVKNSRLITDNANNVVGGVSNEHIGCEKEIDRTKEKAPVCKTVYVDKTCNEEIRSVRRVCERVPYVTIVDDPYPGCQRHVSPGDVEDCLAGQVQIPHYKGAGRGKIVIPKNRGARVGFSDSRHPFYYITILNEETGQHVGSPRTRVHNGYYLELPVSETQDQTFSFIVDRWDRCSCHEPGRMNIYINYLRKIPNVEWKEELCRNV